MRRLVLLWLALVLATGCAPTVPPTAAGAPTAVHLIIVVDGQVGIKREGWRDFIPAVFGMPLRGGDLLRRDAGATMVVACADLTLAAVHEGVSGAPCPAAKPVLTYGETRVSATRGSGVTPIGLDAAAIPAVVTPRKTIVRTPHPLLRWVPVPSASLYSVTVRGPGVAWTSKVTGATEMRYPDDAPSLAPGSAYKLSVSANGRSSDEETQPGLGFTIAKTEEERAAADAEQRIRNLGLADVPTRFLLAHVYSSQEFNSDALELLQNLSASRSEQPAVARALGDVLLRIGLNRPAEEQFLQALRLSTEVQDVEGQAVVLDRLSQVNDTWGNSEQSTHYAESALALYGTLGDTKSVSQIKERLSQIPGR